MNTKQVLENLMWLRLKFVGREEKILSEAIKALELIEAFNNIKKNEAYKDKDMLAMICARQKIKLAGLEQEQDELRKEVETLKEEKRLLKNSLYGDKGTL